MMEVSSSVKTEEDENELSLELSIGRKCYNNKTNTTTLPQNSVDLAIIDLPLKREIQALRRQEARKKRDEKLKFKSTLSCRGGGDQNGNVCGVEDHGVVDEDEGDEEEAEMPPRKKEKCQSFSYNNYNSIISNVGPKEEKEKEKLHHESGGFMGESPFPYPNITAMQYFPFTNGFVYHPHGVVPSCLGSVVACTNGLMDKRVSFGNGNGGNESLGKDKRVSFDIAACRSFRPYGMNVVNGKSDASSGGSSPAVSDHHNSSLQGGSSSMNFPQEGRNAFSAANGPKKSDVRSWDSMGMVSNQVKVKTKANDTVNMTSSTNMQDRESMYSEELKPGGALIRDVAPFSTCRNPTDPVLSKKESSNAVNPSPLKPQTECNGGSHLPQMPCVSTTGKGPNGKTITGFLYRYTKTEVCIVCVCHGTSFSPAEFVKHAGGVDVEHPLRHITIVPSDFA
ncbi:hypothetical protein POM88_053960 [Heracleum sosnowskyi]|uniref:Ninja-family protein n=1 Tax=Heracleum sosnowskyi TaxID=360622 RepID=A0AAD8GP01_9APIA|nr:hypothetical protein POM88_053960 [Heracleum sosnowskyi]